MSSSGSDIGSRAGPTPQGKASTTNFKPTSSIFDRYKEHKEMEAGEEGRDPKEPLTKTTMVNKYRRTLGGGGGGHPTTMDL
jgi:hypothetical protein